MTLALALLSLALLWLGIDALWLSKHSSPPVQLEKDRMMFGEVPRRSIPAKLRAYLEQRAPFATATSMQFYGILFLAAGILVAWLAWETRA
jgi:hypothetical protein